MSEPNHILGSRKGNFGSAPIMTFSQFAQHKTKLMDKLVISKLQKVHIFIFLKLSLGME